jgi:predicted ATPase/class 3 adenylate cyclase
VTGTLPSGVVSFLFTDIEGSTKLWERWPEAMRVALADHDAILRRAIESSEGIVFKSVGDALCSAFAEPRKALTAAIEGQRALRAHDWPSEVGTLPVRMAVHCGECTQRDGDFFGPTLNRVSRLMSIAYGEQILVSAAVAALLRDSLEGAVTLRALGPIHLKDLSHPEDVFQVVAAGLRSEFPAPVSLDTRPNNMPSQISTFVGRADELQELDALISRGRLLTIAGPGGIGKTRLALALAASRIEQYAGGVWFADLTAIHSAALVGQTIATALHVRELYNEPIEATLVAHLRTKQLLLVIDNAEHLLAGVAQLVKTLLESCPGLTVLTTSREPLHLTGEQVYRLGPLAAAPAYSRKDALSKHDSTRLFLERAFEASPGLVIADSDVADIVALCERLDGLPLAIELACARLSSMPLKQLVNRLRSGLALSSKDSTESARHRTLRETIAWSDRLLEPEERQVLAELSVFHGGCTSHAARTVAREIADVDEVLDSLVDKSLVQLDDRGTESRYRLLEAVREYARGRLQTSGNAPNVEVRHAAYYADVVRSATQQASGGDFSPYTALDTDAPNIRAALEWSFAHDNSQAVRMLVDLAAYWRLRGNLTEARSWISRALEEASHDDSTRVALLCLAASFATLQDELAESLRFAGEALDLGRSTGDLAGTANASFRIAEARHRQGQLDEAEGLYREALEHFSGSGDARLEMLCLANLGMLARQRGELHDAVDLLEDAIERAQRLGERRLLGEFRMSMGWVQVGLNDFAQSRRLFEQAFADKCEDGDRYGICGARHGLGTVALKQERRTEALAEFLATLHTAMELRLKNYVARAFHGIAAVEALEGNPELGQRLLGLADRLYAESGRELRDSVAYDVALNTIEAAVPESRRSALREEGARMTVDDALSAIAEASL